MKPKEYALLEFLMRHSDRPVTRSLIIEHVWDIHFDSISNVVEVHINSLRSKIDRGFAVPLIHTVRGVGYMLAAPASRLRMTLPFQTRLILFCTVTFALLLTVLSLASYRLLAQQLDVDATADLAELTTDSTDTSGSKMEPRRSCSTTRMPIRRRSCTQATRYYQIYDGSDGRLLVQSPGLEPLGLHLTPGEVRTFLDEPTPYDIQTAYGRFRISNSVIDACVRRTVSASGRGVSRSDGRGAQAIPRAAAAASACRAWSSRSSPCGGWPAGRWRRSRRWRRKRARVNIDTLDRRLHTRGTGDQLDDVASAFNETLANLENAVGEMRQFSSALAHELRTPLAALRGEMELALLRPGSESEWRTSAASQIDEIDKLTRMVNQLLTLARAESGEIPLAHDAVDLGALAATVTEQLEPVAQARDLDLHCVVHQPVTVTGDSGWLERLLLNLLDNAMKYTPPRGHIRVGVSREKQSRESRRVATPARAFPPTRFLIFSSASTAWIPPVRRPSKARDLVSAWPNGSSIAIRAGSTSAASPERVRPSRRGFR